MSEEVFTPSLSSSASDAPAAGSDADTPAAASGSPSSPSEASSDVTAIEANAPAKPFSLGLPDGIRILFHLPPQSRGYTGRINGCFYYTTEFGRFDKEGRHFWDGGLHAYEGRLLTVQEFLSPRVQKYLLDDSLVVRPVVRLVVVDADAAPQTASSPGISKDELASLLATLDSLRLELTAKQGRIDELEGECSTYKEAIDRIERETLARAENLESSPAPDTAPAPDSAAGDVPDAPKTPAKRGRKPRGETAVETP